MCCGGGTAVYAEEQPKEYTLADMVVTATRTEQSNMKVASLVHVITDHEIKNKNILTITDALKTVPGIYDNRPGGMSETANGIQMRGFEEKDILVLYDGMPLNDGFSGKVNWSVVSIDDVAKIEVMQGAASSLYGGHAVGGVINIIGKTPDKNNVHVYGSYGSLGTKKQGINLSKKLTDKWSMGLGYEKRKTEGHTKKLYYDQLYYATATPYNPIATGGVLASDSYGTPSMIFGNTGDGSSDDDTYNFKVQYKFDNDKSLTYRFTRDEYKYYAGDVTTYMKDANGNPIYTGSVKLDNGKYMNFYEDEFTDYDGERNVNRHALRYKDDANKIDFNIGFTDVRDNGYSTGDDLAGKTGGWYTNYPNKTYKIDFQKGWEGKVHNVVAGFDIEKGSMDYSTNYLAHWKDHNTGYYMDYIMGGTNLIGALFLQDQIKLSDQHALDLGLRLDHYEKKDGYYTEIGKPTVNQREESYNELSPKVAYRYMPDDDTTFYASYGHSFNAPTLYQLYRTNSSFIANPDLKPEKTDTVEAGMKKQFSKKLYGGITVYQSKSKDLITYVYVPGTRKKQYVNLEYMTHQGVEFMTDYKFDKKYGVFANLTLQNVVKGDRSREYSVPKQILKAGVTYDYGKLYAYLQGQYVSTRNYPGDVGNTIGTEDNFFTTDAGINYKFAKNAKVSLYVNNLLNRSYWQWRKAADRTWMTTFDFEF